jgi:hypothetical protein
MIEGMSAPVSFKDRIPPGLVTLVIAYGLCLGCLTAIRYFDLSDFFFPRSFLNDLTIGAVIVGPLYIVGYFVSYFHPEWRDWSKDNNLGGD